MNLWFGESVFMLWEGHASDRNPRVDIVDGLWRFLCHTSHLKPSYFSGTSLFEAISGLKQKPILDIWKGKKWRRLFTTSFGLRFCEFCPYESPLQLRHGESSCSAPVVGSRRPIVLHRCLVRCRSATHGATIGRGCSTHVGQLCGLGEGHEREARIVLKSGMKVTRIWRMYEMMRFFRGRTTTRMRMGLVVMVIVMMYTMRMVTAMVKPWRHDVFASKFCSIPFAMCPTSWTQQCHEFVPLNEPWISYHPIPWPIILMNRLESHCLSEDWANSKPGDLRNTIATAGVLGGVTGLLLGGFWLGAASFVASSYLAKKAVMWMELFSQKSWKWKDGRWL